jgi:hypothetical protein
MSAINCVDNQRAASGRRAAQQERKVRIEKVLDIRRRLGEGRYNIADKINAASDKLLEDLLRQP